MKSEAGISRRWAIGLEQTSDYFYDEPITRLSKKSSENDFPPANMDLSDAWVVAIVRSGISSDDCFSRWPVVFTQRSLRSTFFHEGQAHKEHDGTTKIVKYARIFGQLNMWGRPAGITGQVSRHYARCVNNGAWPGSAGSRSGLWVWRGQDL